MHLPRILAMLAAATLVACGDSDSEPDARDPAACGDVRVTTKVYFGTSTPSYAPLSPGQIQAIGSWTKVFQPSIFCSGTLIAPRFVLTAAHCPIDAGDRFCIGDKTHLSTCVRARKVHSAPRVVVDGKELELDISVAELEDDATTIVIDVVPIPIAVEPLTDLTGHRVETAGFGETERKSVGTRLFALERVDAVGPSDDIGGAALLRVDGLGARGVCVGDSGGPALIVDSAGAVRVAGTLAFGDQSCVDKDRYTRVDVARAWIEGITGPTAAAPVAPCGPITATGTCSGNRSLHCDGGRLVATTCSNVCGWDTAADGFRCIAGADPCKGEDAAGSCAGDVAQWCERGVAKSSDCGCLAQSCVVDSASGAVCRDAQ